MFNAEQFLSTELTAGFSTEFVPIPDGEWGPAQCIGVNARANKAKDGSGEEFISLDTNWEIQDDELKRTMGIDRKLIARYSFLLEFDDNGQLKRGKGENVQLGLLLEAVGMNAGDFVPMALKGQMVQKVKTKQRFGDGGEIYVDIKSVA